MFRPIEVGSGRCCAAAAAPATAIAGTGDSYGGLMTDTQRQPNAGSVPEPSAQPASERITEQLGRLIPLVNGSTRQQRLAPRQGRADLASLLSWDHDGQLKVD